MTEEEQKAIEIVNSLKEWGKIHFIVKDRSYARLNYDEVYLILNLISKLQEEDKELREGKDTAENELKSQLEENKKLQTELDKKDKVIGLMANQLSIASDRYEYMEETEIIEYFYKKVGGEDE